MKETFESTFDNPLTLERLCKELHGGKCPHFIDGCLCEYPDEDCLECDPVVVASRWLSPDWPRNWDETRRHGPNGERGLLTEVLKELRADGR